MSDYDKTIDYLIKKALKASRKAGKKALRPGKLDHDQRVHFRQAEQLINIARKLEELKDVK